MPLDQSAQSRFHSPHSTIADSALQLDLYCPSFVPGGPTLIEVNIP